MNRVTHDNNQRCECDLGLTNPSFQLKYFYASHQEMVTQIESGPIGPARSPLGSFPTFKIFYFKFLQFFVKNIFFIIVENKNYFL